MKRAVLLFGGQGTQALQMCRSSLAIHFPEYHDYLAIVEQKSGLPIGRVVDSGPLETLHLTQYTQPALLLTQVTSCRYWLQVVGQPYDIVGVLGHSIGEYAALVVAGSLSFEDAVDLVVARAQLMATIPGKTMVLFTSLPTVRALLADHFPGEGTCEVSAVNSPKQVCVSGDAASISTFRTVARQNRIACRILPNPYPFHSSLMDPILTPFRAHVEEVHFNPPTVPWISGLDGKVCTDPTAIRNQLVSGIAHPVQFSQMIATSVSHCRARYFYQAGGNHSLLNLARDNLPDEKITYLNV